MKNQIIKDAFWQILGRAVSALGGFVTIRMMTPFLGPLRYGDYNTILKYFAIRSALADLGLYTIALRELGKMKGEFLDERGEIRDKTGNETISGDPIVNEATSLDAHGNSNKELTSAQTAQLSGYYSKFMGSRVLNLIIVYAIALVVAYLIPSYSNNPFIVWGLPLGMIFSATFVLGYFFQLPHQLFWSMQHTSISLVIARVGQISLLALILFVFPHTELSSPTSQNIVIFALILCTVVASGLFQIARQRWTGRKYLRLSRDVDRSFFVKHIKDNRKYGVGYFMSSFHTLAVGILLSLFYPTTAGFYFVGVWGLAMTLVEILLIVPSSLGNSALHKIAHKTELEKRTSIGNLMTFIWIIGSLIALNFYRFAPTIIEIVSGTKYLSSTLGGIGSDYVLGFLGIVLLLTFTKQVFNYMFIATEHQNRLFSVNTRGVILGIGFATRAVYQFGLIGGIAGQLFVELLYVLGAVWIAYEQKVMPLINAKTLWLLVGWIIFGAFTGFGLDYLGVFGSGMMVDILIIGLYNILLAGLMYIPVKKVLRGI